MGICATGFNGSDDDFVRLVAAGNIDATRARLRDENDGTELVMIEFPNVYGCQIHMHVLKDGEIIAHIKNNAGDRHFIYQIDADAILERLQIRHGRAEIEMAYA